MKRNKNQEELTNKEFGKGVNDYINHSIYVADAKAGAILVSNFVLFGLLLSSSFCTAISLFYFLAVISILASITFCCLVLYPRLPKATKGLIFWDNINQHLSWEEYLNNIKLLNFNEIELEYAKQNWYVSKVLTKKNLFIRYCIIIFWISLIELVSIKLYIIIIF